MTVWIVNPYDNLPLEGYRPQRYWLMAGAFAAAGHDVVLWSSDFSHANKKPRMISCAVEGDGFAVRLVPTRRYKRNISFARILSHRLFARRWLAMAADEKKPDVIVASLPPLSLGSAAAAFCKRVGATFVADVQDAWPETFERVVPRCLLTPLRVMARGIYRAADGISGVAESYLSLAASYGARSPMHLAPLGAQFVLAEPDGPAGNDGLRLVYAGNMGKSYDLATVIDAVMEDTSLRLDIAGAGPDEERLRARAASCSRIVFHGYLSAGPLRRLLASSHVALVPMFDDSLVGIPGKLADYSFASLPVLNSLSGETASLIAEHSAGFSYTAGSKSSFAEALARLRAVPMEDLRKGSASLAAFFDASSIYPGYVRWAEAVAAGKGSV